MKKKIFSLIALILVLATALSSCNSGNGASNPDTPVEAEAILSSFLKLEPAKVTVKGDVKTLSDELGELCEVREDGYAVFYKETKDKLNNLTETYSVWSFEKGEVVVTVSNTYADEYGWYDDFDNETYPPVLITDCYLDEVGDAIYLIVERTHYTPIDEELIEENELSYSFEEKESYEFYDMSGKLIAKSNVAKYGEYVASNDYYTLVSFGKTVAVFDSDNVVKETYDGDVESTPALFDYMKDKYNYLLNVPAGITDSSFEYNRRAIMVYDKSGKLVLNYVHGDSAFMHMPFVLDNGDILLQNLTLVDALYADINMGEGMSFKVDTFVIDVETGSLKTVENFNYLVSGDLKRELTETDDDNVYSFTENVRNVVEAMRFEDSASCTVFFDNLMNVNYVFDGRLADEMGEESFKVLDENHILIHLESGVCNRAIIDASGKVTAYIPDEAIVTEQYVAVDQSVYNFDMQLQYTLPWYGFSVNYEDISLISAVGRMLVYSAYAYEYVNEENVKVDYIFLYDTFDGSYSTYKNTYIFDIQYSDFVADYDDYVVLHSEEDGLFIVINGRGSNVLTAKAVGVTELVEEDGRLLISFVDDEGDEKTYVISDVEAKNDFMVEDDGNKEEYPPEYEDKDEYPDDEKDENPDKEQEGEGEE